MKLVDSIPRSMTIRPDRSTRSDAFSPRIPRQSEPRDPSFPDLAPALYREPSDGSTPSSTGGTVETPPTSPQRTSPARPPHLKADKPPPRKSRLVVLALGLPRRGEMGEYLMVAGDAASSLVPVSPSLVWRGCFPGFPDWRFERDHQTRVFWKLLRATVLSVFDRGRLGWRRSMSALARSMCTRRRSPPCVRVPDAEGRS